ncbi:MAG: cysteine synthase A [Bradymonadia bacterium]
MARIFDDITQTIGRTPLVRLNRIAEGCHGTILAKLEFFNPLSSIKDRVGVAMLDAAAAEGRLCAETVVIEPTSGNTGIALAFAAAVRGVRLILTMPDSMSEERRALLKGLGAELELTPAAEGMQGAVARARALAASHPKSLLLQQFSNPNNPRVHRETTGREIWEDTEGEVHGLVSGVGTGGSITGIGGFLKSQSADVEVFAVEPSTSAVLSGKRRGMHRIQGIGAGFVPENLQRDLIDEVVTVTDKEAFDTARALARLEGIPAGISSGATCAAALKIARRSEWAGRTLVVIFASSAERYLSTPLYKDLLES